MDPVTSFNLVFEYQSSRYKRAESNLLADEKGPRARQGQVIFLYLLYLFMIHMKFLLNESCHSLLQKNQTRNKIWLGMAIHLKNTGKSFRPFLLSV